MFFEREICGNIKALFAVTFKEELQLAQEVSLFDMKFVFRIVQVQQW